MVKYQLKIAFGEKQAREIEEDGFLQDNSKYWTIKEFNSSIEREAYIRGIEDMTGWLEVYWEKSN